MSKNVIEVEHLYKEYRLGLIGYGTLREDMQSWWARLRGKEDPNSMLFTPSGSNEVKTSDHILALNDVSLEVEHGERLGIIGANGAGKTTLLKILSRIASPTKGVAKIKGRVASLIAVGTGFHSELTGRENIYLNGSILGLRKFEIDERFDEIVDFAGVENFIDTPVKRYSSGMYVRLGFAVAAHLDPDVLIVDEVLAVGDAEFRKKALGKMKHVSENQGRTILFVSHNMETIEELCDRSILLDNGAVSFDGKTSEVIHKYLVPQIGNRFSSKGETAWSEKEKPGNDFFRINSIETKTEDGEISASFDVTKPVILEVKYTLSKATHLALEIDFDKNGAWLFSTVDDSYYESSKGIERAPGDYLVSFQIPKNILQDGDISIIIHAFDPRYRPQHSYLYKMDKLCFSFKLKDSFEDDGARRKFPFEWYRSLMRPEIKAKTVQLNSNNE